MITAQQRIERAQLSHRSAAADHHFSQQEIPGSTEKYKRCQKKERQME